MSEYIQRLETHSSESGDVDENFALKEPRKTCRCCSPVVAGASCCGTCCTLVLLIWIALTVVGCMQVKINHANEQDPRITPLQFPRYSSCAGCREGNKSDQEITSCARPCFGLKYVLDWEDLAKKAGFKLVYFPSRPGPKSEPPVNLSAWWLPPLPRPGIDVNTAPRIVAMHGLASNNNHCGLQAMCYLLRSMGFGCLAPSVRDSGLSGASDHPKILTWGYDDESDLLGAWDYAVADPQRLLGGALNDDQVGIMGFSKGALAAAIAFGQERRIPGAWLDSGPYSGLRGIIDDYVRPYVGTWAPAFREPVMWSAKHFSGGRVDYWDAFKLWADCHGPPRSVMFSHGSRDTDVPISETMKAVVLVSGLTHCYTTSVWTPQESCNSFTHHQEMWQFPDDTRAQLCKFWSATFGKNPALCGLDNMTHYQS